MTVGHSISLTHSFPGRTPAMIAATGNPAVRQGFEPDVPGFSQVQAGNFDALKNAVDEHTGGILRLRLVLRQLRSRQ